MTLAEKAKQMRDALDALELALNGIPGFDALEPLWQGGRDDLKVRVEMSVATLRQLTRVYEECNAIVNDPEFGPEKLK